MGVRVSPPSVTRDRAAALMQPFLGLPAKGKKW